MHHMARFVRFVPPGEPVLRAPQMVGEKTSRERPFAALRMTLLERGPGCHAEPMRCAQGKLREGALRPASQILRYAQDDRCPASQILRYAQDDRHSLRMTGAALRVMLAHRRRACLAATMPPPL